MTSLVSKITTSYGLSKIALLIFVAVVIADLHYLQTQIVEGEAVNDFFTTTQEIRFDEKNLFLYHHSSDYDKLQGQLKTAENILSENQRVFSEIASDTELKKVNTLLDDYRQQLEQYMGLSESDRLGMQDKIRVTGHAITELIRDFNQRIRVVLTETTQVAARTLMIASVTVILLGILSAMFMVRRVVRPLRDLEKQLDELAEGNEQTLTLPSQDKEIQSFVHHFNSMLDRLRAQQNQTRQHEKAAALGVLVSGVAHELNNPLSNISTSVQLLLEDDGTTRDDLRRQWLAHVDGECERARRIVRRLLDSVRQPKLHLQSHNADVLVQSAVLLIHRQLPPTIYLHIEDIPSTPLLVDRERMQQVFINLIRNAVDAGAQNISVVGRETTWEESMPANTDYLVGDIEPIRHAAGVMQFNIEDDGPGISGEHLAQIFNPFFTTKSSGEGTGLGLYLVEEIISEHNGCMSVENREEGGTRFMVWLPVTNREKNPSE
jgi:two-component system NtrC family sensor kinase